MAVPGRASVGQGGQPIHGCGGRDHAERGKVRCRAMIPRSRWLGRGVVCTVSRYNIAPMPVGILLVLTSAVVFVSSAPFAKLLLASIYPWLTAGLLYHGAGVGLAIVHGLRGALR